MTKNAPKKKPSTAVAERTSPLVLHRGDRVEIAKEDGIPIYVNSSGRFEAEVDLSEIRRDTLEAAKESVHRAVLAKNRKKRAKVTRPVFALNVGHTTWCEDVFFTGVSAKNGEILFRKPDSTKDSERDLYLFTREDPRRKEIEELVRRRSEAQEIVRETGKALEEIGQTQTEKMYAGCSGLTETGWSRSGGLSLRHFNNDAEQALERTLAIVANLFGGEGEE